MSFIEQIALSNFLIFAFAVILIIYIIYLSIKRIVEKNDGDHTLEAKERSKEHFLRKFIFTFLYSVMTAGIVYLVGSDKTSAIIYFIVFFILGLLTSDKRRTKPKSSISKVALVVLLLLLLVLTVIWPGSIGIKVGVWLILLFIYLLERIEKRYFISETY